MAFAFLLFFLAKATPSIWIGGFRRWLQRSSVPRARQFWVLVHKSARAGLRKPAGRQTCEYQRTPFLSRTVRRSTGRCQSDTTRPVVDLLPL